MNAPSVRWPRQTGFTLVELMVAVTLALLIGVAISSVYLGSAQSYRTGNGLSQVQEAGRFTGLLVNPIVRQAGYVADPAGFGSAGSSASQVDPTAIFAVAANQLAIHGYNDTAPTGYTKGFDATKVQPNTDSLAIAFVGQSSATSTTDVPLRTCLGAPVYGNQIAVNVFYIRVPDNGGVPSSLSCYSNVSTVGAGLAAGTTNDQPLIPGVSNLQIVYGIDARNDGSAINYYDAEQVGKLRTDSTFTNPWISINANASPWRAVRSVQMSFTVLSADTVETGLKRAGLSNVDAATGRLTTTVVSTVDIRNRLHN